MTAPPLRIGVIGSATGVRTSCARMLEAAQRSLEQQGVRVPL
jgi:hypothetical protein